MDLNWGILIWGFLLGTFKFLFAHWGVYGSALKVDYDISIIEVFICTTAGAWVSMTIFYWGSSYFMKRAQEKRLRAVQEAKEKGIPYKGKKIFTRMNKTIVWIKRKIGIYGVTLLAPLFLSVPIGSIICAKFYGSRRRTFPLMMLFTASYSILICLWIISIK
ncbi:MAG: hypothetical protein HUJ25_03805 [Crocinitomicaceae bacterium]|nr:hypothetical protein [Crocinitomicaceae bacterium]